MIRASQFAQDIMGPLEIRQEIGDLIFSEANREPADPTEVRHFESRLDDVVRGYWVDTMLSNAEEIGDTRRRPLEEDDIPAVAASLCIQYLMTGAFPDFKPHHAQNLLEGRRANLEAGETKDIETLEQYTIEWLGNVFNFGKRAESGKPTILADSKQFLNVAKRPQIEVLTKREAGKFFCTQTVLTLGTSMSASRQNGTAMPKYNFSFLPHTIGSMGAMSPLKNVSAMYDDKARAIVSRINGASNPISLDELFVLTIAKQSGHIKKLPAEPIKIALAQNRKLAMQDAESFNQLKTAANRAGITFCLAHPVPQPRPRINGRVI